MARYKSKGIFDIGNLTHIGDFMPTRIHYFRDKETGETYWEMDQPPNPYGLPTNSRYHETKKFTAFQGQNKPFHIQSKHLKRISNDEEDTEFEEEDDDW